MNYIPSLPKLLMFPQHHLYRVPTSWTHIENAFQFAFCISYFSATVCPMLYCVSFCSYVAMINKYYDHAQLGKERAKFILHFQFVSEEVKAGTESETMEERDFWLAP